MPVTRPMCGCLSRPSISFPIVTRTPAGGTGAPHAFTRETSTTAYPGFWPGVEKRLYALSAFGHGARSQPVWPSAKIPVSLYA